MARKKEVTVTKNISKTKHIDDRRKRARKKVTGSGDSLAGMSPLQMKKIIHELHVHQVELETQNEQLRQAQLEITEARTKYADLYDFAPVGYFTFDRKGHIIEANVTGASLLGVEKRSVAQQPFQRFIVPGYLSTFQSHLQKAYESRSKQACELRLVKRDGSPIDALIGTVAVVDGKGKLDHYRASVTDITERKREEEVLRESEERYRYLVKYAPTGIYEIDLTKRKFLSVNDVMCQYTGYTREEFLSLDPMQLLTEESQKSFIQRHAKISAVEPVPDNIEYQIKRKDGSEFWALLNNRYYYEPNNRTLSTVIVHDITERKRQEQQLSQSEIRYRELFEYSGTGIIIINQEGVYQLVNRIAAERLGAAAEDIVGKSIFDFFSADAALKYLEANRALMMSGGSREYEDTFLLPGGERSFLTIDRCLKDAKGNVVGIQSSCIDITESKKTQDALVESAALLREAQRVTHVGHWELDISTMTPTWSEEIFHIFGLDHEEDEPSFEAHQKVTHPDDWSILNNAVTTSIVEGTPFNIEFRILRPDKTIRWMHAIGDPKKDSEGRIQSVFGTAQDITDRKLMENALRESEENFRRSLDDSPLGVRIVTIEAETIYANRAILDIYGYDSIEELRTTPLKERYTPESLAEFQARREKRKRGDYGQSEYEISIVKKDGEVRHLHVFRKEILWDGERQFQVLYNDITDRRRLEELLKKEQQELKLIIDSSPIIVFYKDKEGKFIRVNKAFAEVLELPEEEFVGKTVFDIYSAKFAQGMTNDDQEVIKSGHPKLNITEQYESASGTRWAQTDKIPICDENGIPLGLIGFAQDITDRKLAEEALQQSEKRFRDITDNAAEWVWEVDAEGKYTYSSPVVEQLLGYKSEEIRGKHFYDFFHPADREELRKTALEVFANKKPFRELLNRNLNKNGETVWLSTSAVPILDEKGNLMGYRGADTDITDRKLAEEALRKSEEKFIKTFQSNPACVGLSRLSDGLYIEANEAMLNLLGYSKDEFIGHTIAELGVWNDLRDRGRLVQTLTTEGRSANQEYWFRTKTGELLLCNHSAEMIQIDNEPHIIFTFFDMTERRRAEETLRESEARFANIFNASPVAIAITRFKDNRLIDVNLAWQKATGYSREEVIDRTPFELNTWVNRGERDRLISMMLEQGTVRDFHFHLRHKSGTILEMLMSAELIELAGERYILSLAQDITERRRAEETLRRSQVNYQRLYDSMMDAFCEVDMSGRIIRFNRSFSEMLGYTVEELLRLTYADITPARWHAMEERFIQEQVIPRGHSDVYEKEYMRKDGTVFPVELHTFLIRDENGKPSAMWAIVRDITERKRTEESLENGQLRLTEAMVLAQAANWEFDVESRVFTFDDRFYALYGTSAEREGGNRMSAEDYARNFLFPEDVQIVADEIARAIAEPDHRAAWQLEHRIRRRDGQTRYISVHISVIKNDHGRTVMTRGVNQDITERKLAEESIKASHQQLRALAGRLQFAREEQRKQIAREIHDEMGGALTALKIDLSSLARSAPKSWHKIKSDSFLSKIIGMTKLIDETIGTVRRIVTELRPSILDDFGLMAALEWQLWEFQKRTGIQSEFVSTLEDVNIDEKLSITVFRIFQEALTNVVRHANATDVIATLYKEADSLVLKVEDNGKGISEDDIHNTKSVGLIGMRERAFFLGGTVNISGDPSKGTIVSVQFPYKTPSPQA